MSNQPDPARDLSIAAERSREGSMLRRWADLATGRRSFDDIRSELLSAPALDTLTLDLTYRCDLRCPGMCYYHPSRERDAARPDVAVLQRVIDECRQHLGTRAVVFAGKEPTLALDLLIPLLQHCEALGGIETGLVTNGGQVERRWESLRAARDHGLSYLDLSIDSADTERHDLIRGRRGAFTRVMRALDLCAADLAPVRVGVNSVLRTDNVPDLAALIERLGPRSVPWYVTPFAPPAWSAEPSPDATVLDAFLREVTAWMNAHPDVPVDLTLRVEGIFVDDMVRLGWIDLSELLEDATGRMGVVRTLGAGHLTFECVVVPETAWRIARITADGWWLPNSHYLQAESPASFALGNVNDTPARELYRRALLPDGPLGEVLGARESHECRSMPCWATCFGGLSTADTQRAEGRDLSLQPRQCSKSLPPRSS